MSTPVVKKHIDPNMFRFRFTIHTLCLALAVLFLAGCGAGFTYTIVPDYGDRGIAAIAVMPVACREGEEEVASIFRTLLIDYLYFKGYGKVRPEAVDAATAGYLSTHPGVNMSDIGVPELGRMLNVDALMVCTLDEIRTSVGYLYAPTTITVSFKLVGTKTGDVPWKSRSSKTEHSFGITPGRTEMKSRQVYETAMEEIITEALETLPAGPEYIETRTSTVREWGLVQ